MSGPRPALPAISWVSDLSFRITEKLGNRWIEFARPAFSEWRRPTPPAQAPPQHGPDRKDPAHLRFRPQSPLNARKSERSQIRTCLLEKAPAAPTRETADAPSHQSLAPSGREESAMRFPRQDNLAN
jgi:hypothetical protein